MKSELIDLARARVDDGTLPRLNEFRSAGGRGSGHGCALCGGPTMREHMEIEVEAGRLPALTLHVECYAAWVLAMRDVPG